jgi:KRAB domain-containing zinc finger protein
MCSSTKSSQLSCPLCCQTNFPNIDALRISLIKVTSRPLKCPICDDILLGLDKLTIHLFGHTLLVENESMQKVENSKPTKKVREKKSMTESSNSTKPTTKSKEKTHVFPIATTTTPAIIPSNNSQLAGGQSMCRCDFCGFSFQDSEILTMHMKLVHRFCDKPSEEVNFGNTNPSDNKFQCHLCSKYFKMKGALRIHLRVAHTGFYNQRRATRKNLCDVLQQQMTTTQPLRSTADHQLAPNFPVQTMDLPGHCIQPLKLSYLNESPRLLHSNSYESFPDNAISYHMTANNPLTYEIVEHRLASPLSSPTATISETGVKMWECDICSKSFTTKYFLKKHKRLHTGTTIKAGLTFCFYQNHSLLSR